MAHPASGPPMFRPHDSNAYPAATYLPRKPELALAVYQSPPISPGVTSSIRSHHDSVISHPHSPLTADRQSAPSIASISLKAGRESMSPSDVERAMSTDRGRLRQPAPVAVRDPEKRIVIPTSPTEDSRSRTYHADPEIGIDSFDDSDNYELQGKALRILVYLSAFCPLISIALLFWALVSVFLSGLLLPLRAILSTKLPGLTSLLLPPLRLQLRLIYSAWAADEAFDGSSQKSPALLLVIHLFSPAIAPLMAVASWVAAFFWFFSAVLGDPAGKDGHNDGRAAVLTVRNWWESWLIRGLR